MSEYEWDENKRQWTIRERKLDFFDARLAFDGRPVMHIPVRVKGEDRILSIAMMGEKCHTVVWTKRAEKRRIISFRRSRHGEEKAYRKLYH